MPSEWSLDTRYKDFDYYAQKTKQQYSHPNSEQPLDKVASAIIANQTESKEKY